MRRVAKRTALLHHFRMSKSFCCAALLACFFIAGCAGDSDLVVQERDSSGVARATNPNPSSHLPRHRTHDENGWPTGQ
jgi:hypothetical protein